jgi:hypothetical protein
MKLAMLVLSLVLVAPAFGYEGLTILDEEVLTAGTEAETDIYPCADIATMSVEYLATGLTTGNVTLTPIYVVPDTDDPLDDWHTNGSVAELITLSETSGLLAFSPMKATGRLKFLVNCTENCTVSIRVRGNR